MNEKEARERVEKYIKSFNGNALDCVAIGTVLTLLEKKDKIIDLMAKWLYEDDTSFGYGKLKDVNTSEKIKQYFKEKVKEV